MRKQHGAWTSSLALFYYISGSLYYGFHWFLIFGGASFLASGILAYFKKAPFLIPVLCLFGLAGAICGISFARKLAKLRLRSHNPALEIKEITVDYIVRDDRNCEYSRVVTVRARFPVEYYQALFNWTGQGGVTPVALKGVKDVDVFDHSKGVDNVCQVHFGDTLPKGREHTFAYRLILENAQQPVRSFLGHTVDSPTKGLALKVHLPATHQVRQYKRQIFISSKDNLHLWEETVFLQDPQDKVLEWVVPHVMNYYYRISW